MAKKTIKKEGKKERELTKEKKFSSDKIKKELSLLKKSLNSQFLRVLLFDLLFYAGAGIFSILWLSSLYKQTKKLFSFSTSTQMLSEVTMANYRWMNIIFYLGLILFILIWFFFKYLVWLTVFEQGFNWKRFSRFFGLNIIWHIFWTPIFLFFLFFLALLTKTTDPGVIPEVIMRILFLFLIAYILYKHFSYLLYWNFFKKNNIFDSIAQALRIGIIRIIYLIVPYFFVFVVFALIWLTGVVLMQVNSSLALGVMGILYLIAFSWVKIYTKEVYEKVTL